MKIKHINESKTLFIHILNDNLQFFSNALCTLGFNYNMYNMLLLIVYFIISKPESCSSFNLERIFMRDAKDKTIEGKYNPPLDFKRK